MLGRCTAKCFQFFSIIGFHKTLTMVPCYTACPPCILYICYCCSVAKLLLTLCNPVHCSIPGLPSFTISRSLLKLMSIQSVMPSNHLILCHPLLLLPSIFPSIRVFSNESALDIRWPTYWSFSFSVNPSSECLGLIPFRMDWFDLLAVPRTLMSLLQCHSSKASILQHSAFLMVQLSLPVLYTVVCIC